MTKQERDETIAEARIACNKVTDAAIVKCHKVSKAAWSKYKKMRDTINKQYEESNNN